MWVVSALTGYNIVGTDGQIGTVSDILFDDTIWKLRWLVVDTGGWLTGRKVLIHPSAIGRADPDRQELHVHLTKERISTSPDISQDAPVSVQMQSGLYDYYGWDPMWGGSYFGGGLLATPPLVSPSHLPGELGELEREGFGTELEGDPHLRSIAAITGYHVHATDGDIGHVQDILIEEQGWAIRYVIIDTKNWWPGQHVLVAPYAVKEVSWADQKINLTITRDQVTSSPPWDPLAQIDEAYQRGLHRHYDWPGYGW
jgi:sporulation protein YlmC with PRC-barrel domain